MGYHPVCLRHRVPSTLRWVTPLHSTIYLAEPKIGVQLLPYDSAIILDLAQPDMVRINIFRNRYQEISTTPTNPSTSRLDHFQVDYSIVNWSSVVD